VKVLAALLVGWILEHQLGEPQNATQGSPYGMVQAGEEFNPDPLRPERGERLGFGDEVDWRI
jgi:hypothetical protein